MFVCPVCRHSLDEGYRCAACGHQVEVSDGIARFVSAPSDRQVQEAFDLEHTHYQESAFTQFRPELVDEFLREVQLPADFFAGKTALDAGCGSGRWSYALARLGANVVAIDFTSSGVEATRRGLNEAGTVAQADLLDLPFEPQTFDFVLSWGVLNHTRSTRDTFERVDSMVRPGGTLFVMVYERESRLRMGGTNLVRSIMRRLSPEQRYRACRYLIIRNERVYWKLNRLLMLGLGGTADDATLQLGLYDAYSPRFNHTHTSDEVARWFEENGFLQTVIDMPGAVRIRGTRRGS